jgi:ABC-type uncharacterized transport system permease subunit
VLLSPLSILAAALMFHSSAKVARVVLLSPLGILAAALMCHASPTVARVVLLSLGILAAAQATSRPATPLEKNSVALSPQANYTD